MEFRYLRKYPYIQLKKHDRFSKQYQLVLHLKKFSRVGVVGFKKKIYSCWGLKNIEFNFVKLVPIFYFSAMIFLNDRVLYYLGLSVSVKFLLSEKINLFLSYLLADFFFLKIKKMPLLFFMRLQYFVKKKTIFSLLFNKLIFLTSITRLKKLHCIFLKSNKK